MKEERLAFSVAFATMIFFAIITFHCISIGANPTVEMYGMQATAYCCGTTTASQKPVKEGMCASKKEWIGYMAVIYERKKDGTIGDYIGTYDIEDTGGRKIRTGKVIDIYMKDYNRCMKFGRKNVYVHIVKGEG